MVWGRSWGASAAVGPSSFYGGRVRGPVHVVEAARIGADICTCPPKSIESLFNHPLTDIGLDKFMADWAETQRSVG